MKLNKSLVIAMLAGMMIFASCKNEKEPGRTFIPDMQYSKAIETYDAQFDRGTSNRNGNTSAMLPVEGTIARGHLAKYTVPNTDSGYAAAAAVMSPIEMTDMTVKEGKELYTTYCSVCHGTKIDGEGTLYTSGKFPAAPANLVDGNLLTLEEGKIFHVITHGKGVMGSHASQLLAKERWKVVHYIKSVQAKELEKRNATQE